MAKTDDPGWTFRYRAACRDNTDEHAAAAKKFGLMSHKRVPQIHELWFPPRDKKKYKPIAAYSKKVCNGSKDRGPCPVRAQCLIEAMDSDEQHGIWGGKSHRERNALKRKLDLKGFTVQDFVKKWKVPVRRGE